MKHYLVMLNVSDSEVEYFKSDIEKYNSLEIQINDIKKKMKPLQEKLKELNKLKLEKQQEVIQFMTVNELDACNINDASFEVKNVKSTKPINKGDIYDRIYKFFTEEFSKLQTKDAEEISKALHNFIYVNGREVTEKQTLKTK